ncbi:hypothetical protein SCUCBS95973_007895 [Sporothrix curviconia]|uniref:Uncharacterized protein n=1 Tax=Sporothrix curviconia TaxID=1260050 RepID=A0ABP0CH06_9PEZI
MDANVLETFIIECIENILRDTARPLQIILHLLFIKVILVNLVDMLTRFTVRVRAAQRERLEDREEARIERAFHRQRNLYMMQLAVARAQYAINIPLRDRPSPRQEQQDYERFLENAEATFDEAYARVVVLDE